MAEASYPSSLEQGVDKTSVRGKGKGLAFWLIVLSLCISLFLSALELVSSFFPWDAQWYIECPLQTSVSNALPTIVQDLHGEDFVWVGSAYALSSTAVLPASGALAEVRTWSMHYTGTD